MSVPLVTCDWIDVQAGGRVRGKFRVWRILGSSVLAIWQYCQISPRLKSLLPAVSCCQNILVKGHASKNKFLLHLLVTRCPNPSTILPQICCVWYPNNHSCCCCCQNQTKKAAGRQVAHFSDIWKLPVSIWEISPWCPGLRCKQMSLRTVVPMQWKSCAEMSKKELGVERKMVFWCLILVAFLSDPGVPGPIYGSSCL